MAQPSVADPSPTAEPASSGSAGQEHGDADPAEPTAAAPPPTVEVKGSKFIGDGEVPKIDEFLDKTRDEVAKCVAQHGGLERDEGHLRMQFLVRDRSRAEGVEVLASEGVAPAALGCVRDFLRGRFVGAPTADPVGVTFRYELRAAE